MKHMAPCGCSLTLTAEYMGPGSGFEWCPLHAAAPALLEALEALIAPGSMVRIDLLPQARAAIKLARGGESK